MSTPPQTRTELVETLIGSTLADQYRLESLLGQGGMGAVFKARPVNGGEPVALKIIWNENSESSLLPRFMREARLSARIRHAHVVQVLDFGRWGKDREQYFLVTQLIDGVGLERLEDARLGVGPTCELMGQILEALAHVHARGILHRDIKPDNVLISRQPNGTLWGRLTDFGIAAAMDTDDAARITRAGEALGTPLFMAPEQAMGDVLTGPTLDLYPIGVMLYRMLTGCYPFEGRTVEVLVNKATRDPVWRAPEGVEIPSALQALILKLLARRPEHRHAVAADVLRDLEPFRTPATLPEDRWNALCAGVQAPPAGRDTLEGAPTLLATQTAPPPAALQPLAPPRFHGRDTEIARLQAVATGVQEGGQVAVAVIRGTVGIGKSALARQLGHQLAEAGHFQLLLAASVRGAPALAGIRNAFDQLLGTTGRGAAQVDSAAREFLRRCGEEDEDEVESFVAFLRPSALDEAAAADRRGRNLSLIARMLRRLARRRPVLLLLDDLHHAGPDLVAVVDYLLNEASLEPFPLLILATTTEGEGGTAFRAALGRLWRFAAPAVQELPLGPLPLDVLSHALVAAGHELDFAERVARRARGNPLFAQHLSQAGDAFSTPDAFAPRTTGTLASQTRLPESLRAIIQASIDARLAQPSTPEQAADVLLLAAILGEEFDVGTLEGLIAEARLPVHDLDALLDALLDMELLVEHRLDGRDALAFPHALARDAILAGAGTRRSRKLHRQAADVRRRLAGEAPGPQSGAIGDHLFEAEQLDLAAVFWRRAVEWEMSRGEANTAVAWGMKALNALPHEDPRWAEAAGPIGRVLAEIGDSDAAQAVLTRALAHPDTDRAMLAGEVLGDMYENLAIGQGRWDESLQTMERRFNDAGPVGRRAFWRARALWLINHEDLRGAAEAAQLAYETAEHWEERQRGAYRYAICCSLTGDKDAALRITEAALAEVGHRDDLRLRGLRVLGVIHTSLGQLERARAIHEEVYEIARRTGRLNRIPVFHSDMSSLFHVAGDLEMAREHAREAVRTGRALGDRWPELFASFVLLVYDLIEGKLDGVQERAAYLLREAVKSDMRVLIGTAGAIRAWIYAIEGNFDAALAIFDQIPDAAALPRVPIVPEFFEHIGRRFAEGGRAEVGLTLLETGRDLWRACGNIPRADHLTDELERRRADL